ncbi:DEAD/DEAH box helicase [Alienimonas sp. DA493]|uniref:DEAD/DEAH box helicase n=1 Tax=Alienimonas sp. DA493 TaxID=3373605 RepID=UPI0037541C58
MPTSTRAKRPAARRTAKTSPTAKTRRRPAADSPQSSRANSKAKRTRSQSNDEKEAAESGPTFADLGLSKATLATLDEIGFERPSKIQAAFLPIALSGRDCSGQARTGTGKTAAFTLPLLEKLDLDRTVIQGLVLAPTRELAEQVSQEMRKLSGGRVKTVVIVGGRPMGPQIEKIKKGAQVVVGTPGRVMDLMGRGQLGLENVAFAVLDEADRMLDDGFRPDIEKILRKCPKDRQTLLLSATMPPEVEELAAKFMKNPERVDMSEDALVATEMIEQFVLTVDPDRKYGALLHVLKQEKPKQCLVFTRTKRGAEKLFERFSRKLPSCAMMHGDLHQRKREKTLQAFREGKIRMLVATDVVGRGIDISGISHIVNFDVPEFQDDYVHRIGRTGRMSSDTNGRAITFVSRDQGDQLTKIEIRVSQVLPTYELKDYEAARPVVRKSVQDHDATVIPVKKVTSPLFGGS